MKGSKQGNLLKLDFDFKCKIKDHYMEKINYICTDHNCELNKFACC